MIDDNCPKTEVIEQIRDLIDLDNMATVDFYSFGSWVHSQTVRSGGDITYSGPEMLTVKGENDDHIFIGWGDTPDGPVNASILKNVLKSKKAYAIYEKRFRGWNAYFYNGDELIFTAEGIPDGGAATYLGRPQKQGVLPSNMFEFDKWSQAPVDMHSNAYCYAQYKCPALTETITDSWSEIFEHIDDGTYSTRYRIGDTKILDIGTEGMVAMEIVAFDADDKAYGEGKAPISWLAMQALPT